MFESIAETVMQPSTELWLVPWTIVALMIVALIHFLVADRRKDERHSMMVIARLIACLVIGSAGLVVYAWWSGTGAPDIYPLRLTLWSRLIAGAWFLFELLSLLVYARRGKRLPFHGHCTAN